MPEFIQEIAALLLKYLHDELTAEEQAKLETWASASPLNRHFLDMLSTEKIIKVNPGYDEAETWQKIDKALSESGFPE
jgi:hypothetical protein